MTPACWHAPKQRSFQASLKEDTSALVFPSIDVVLDLQGLYLHFFTRIPHCLPVTSISSHHEINDFKVGSRII